MMQEVATAILDKAQAPAQEQAPQAEVQEVTPAHTEQKPPENRVSSKMEVLIKREQQARSRELAAEQKIREAEEKWAKYQDYESAKSNPKKALELLGLTYDELTQSLLQDGVIPPEVQIKKIDEKFERLLKSQEEDKRSRAEEEQKRAEATANERIGAFKTEITTFLGDNSSRYELIKFEGQEDLVYGVIEENYNRTIDQDTGVGKIMSIADAADMVEKHLEEKYNKSRSVSKVKALWDAVPKGPIKEAAKQINETRQMPKTLTNQLNAQAPPKKATFLTDDQRVQKAIAYARSLNKA